MIVIKNCIILYYNLPTDIQLGGPSFNFITSTAIQAECLPHFTPNDIALDGKRLAEFQLDLFNLPAGVQVGIYRQTVCVTSDESEY